MKIQRTCMRDPIRDTIVSRILDGVYAPGMRLKELALAKEFNVSQAPIREALRELEAIGLVETEHYRGTRVRTLELGELRDAYELRRLLEQASVMAAAPYKAADLDYLAQEIQNMRASNPNDLDQCMTHVLRFHRRLIEMSGNSMFVQAWQSMAWGVRARVTAKRVGIFGPYIEIREKLLAAMRANDSKEASKLVGSITDKLLAKLAEIDAESARKSAA